MTKKEFFPHIAGLRGLALLFVLLFHLNGTQWANGYLGVEVFLVIMGYLIFKARVDRGGNDTLKQCAGYLMKRVRRIVPPMLVVILATLSIGVFIFSPTDQSASVQLGHEACLLQPISISSTRLQTTLRRVRSLCRSCPCGTSPLHFNSALFTP